MIKIIKSDDKKMKLALGIFLVWTLAFFIVSRIYTKEVLNTPISLVPAGSIDTKINILLEEVFTLSLEFDKSTINKNIANGSGLRWELYNGVPIPIHWEIFTVSGLEPILQGDSAPDSFDSSSKDYYRRVIGNIKLKPGDYRLVLNVTKNIPEFEAVPIKLRIGLDGKNSSTWQLGTIIFLQILEPFVWLIDAILLIAYINRRMGKQSKK